MISAKDAKAAAEKFVRASAGTFEYRFVETRWHDREWVAIFDMFTERGERLDGPAVVRVDAETGRAWFLPSL